MQLPLILFFGSLIGIIVMIARKLLYLQTKEMQMTEEFLLEIPNLEEVKINTLKNIKKYGFVTLVISLRLYVLSIDFIKEKTKQGSNKIKNYFHKHFPKKEKIAGSKEASGFLKTISEYKKKIDKIKHRIKQEEGIN